MSTEPQRTCASCGNEFSRAMEFCPVCVLRKALADGVESGESSASDDTVQPTTPEQTVQRFEHYELVTGEDGKPVVGIWSSATRHTSLQPHSSAARSNTPSAITWANYSRA